MGLCYDTPPASWSATGIRGFAPDIADTRWGFLITTIDSLLRVEAPLRAHWDGAKIDVPALREGGGEEGTPTDFVNSPAHWAYARMLLSVHSLVDVGVGVPLPQPRWPRGRKGHEPRSPVARFPTTPSKYCVCHLPHAGEKGR